MKINIEDNIPIPDRGRKSSVVTKELITQLKSMTKGQSFLVNKVSTVASIQMWGRKVGKRFRSEKQYKGERKDNNFHFRVWLAGDVKPIEPKPQKHDYTKNQPESFGSLSTSKVESDGVGSATERSKVPNEILTLIELKEENRMIVDDLNKIKNVLRQELGYSDFSLGSIEFMEDKS